MNADFFAHLAPRCPLCLGAGRDSPLLLTQILRESAGEVVEGILGCPDLSCRREYPIVDGMPLFFSDLCGVLSSQGGLLLERQDLSAEMESLLGDALGPASAFDTGRQHLSTYGESHWGDLAEPPNAAGAASAASFLALLGRAMKIAGPPAEGPLLDLGCALGRASFELAELAAAPVLGVDLHLGLLRRAAAARRAGRFHYPRRQVGLVYERAQVELEGLFPRRERVDFWAADALKLPFVDGAFAGILAANLLDCVSSPWELLVELRRVLAPGGVLWLATPWDWSAASTPFPAWLGGHSQRGGRGGRSAEILRDLFGGAHPAALSGFAIAGGEERLPWRLRLHQRSSVDYAVDLLVLRRVAGGGEV